jgi:hypothetical protein
MGKIRLRPSEANFIVYGAPHVGEKNAVTVGSLPFTLGDEGAKTVDSPTVTFRFPLLMKRRGLESMRMKAVGSVSTKDVRTTLTSDEAFDYSSYRFVAFDPGLAAGIDEPFYAPLTVIDESVVATTRDGKPLTISARAIFSLDFLVSTSARDIRAEDYQINLTCAHADGLGDLEGIVANSIAPNEIRQFRESLGFWQYLGGLIFRDAKRKIYLVFQGSDQFKVPNGSLFGPKSSAQVEEVELDLLSWNHLFQ